MESKYILGIRFVTLRAHAIVRADRKSLFFRRTDADFPFQYLHITRSFSERNSIFRDFMRPFISSLFFIFSFSLNNVWGFSICLYYHLGSLKFTTYMSYRAGKSNIWKSFMETSQFFGRKYFNNIHKDSEILSSYIFCWWQLLIDTNWRNKLSYRIASHCKTNR